jgi:hypothetical protein
MALSIFLAILWFAPPVVYLFLFKKACMSFALFFPALYPGVGLVILGAAILRVCRAKRYSAISSDGF